MRGSRASGAVAVLIAVTLSGASFAQNVAWQVVTDGGLTDPGAYGYLSAVDASGNVYAAGRMRNGLDADYLVVSWDSAGVLRWSRTHDGANRGDDRPVAMALDAAGNIVISGTSTRFGVDSFLTVSFDPAGELRWSRLWNHPDFSDAAARSLALAPDGRVVVAGTVDNGSQTTGQVVAYDESGNELWSVARDFVPYWRAAAANDSGDVFVTGGPSANVFADFVTVAFDASGIELWTRVKDIGATDYAMALDVAADGRVLVSGMHGLSPGTGILTVAYDVDGDELWSAVVDAPGSHSDRPRAITSDAAGAAYVVGYVGLDGNESAVVLFSLDTAGVQRWLTLRGSGGAGSEEDFAIAVNDAGVVATAGLTWDGSTPVRGHLVGHASGSGLVQWTKEIPASGGEMAQLYDVATDPEGGFVAVGGTGLGEELTGDMLVVAQETSGADSWTRAEPLMGSADVPGSTSGREGRGALAIGPENRYLVTGRSSQGEVHDALTVAYGLPGQELWSVRRPSLSPLPAGGMAIGADRNTGNVYVMGQAFGANDADYLVDSYDADGFPRWSRTKSGVSGRADYPCCMELGSEERIFVTGYSRWGSDNIAPDVLTVAYEAGGNELWSHEFDGGAGRADFGSAMALGSTGNAFIAGRSVASDGQSDALVLAYDPDGNLLWARTRMGSPGGQAEFLGLAATSDGGVVATGRSGSGETLNILTVAYDPDGSEMWSLTTDGPRQGADSGYSIVVAPSGGVYVVASSHAPGGLEGRMMTIAINQAGHLRWIREKGGVAGQSDEPAVVVLDESGNVFVTGKSGNGTNSDFLTIAYSPGGVELFEYRYDSGGNDDAYLMLPAPGNGVLVGGVIDGLERDFILYHLRFPSQVFSDGFESGDFSAWSEYFP